MICRLRYRIINQNLLAVHAVHVSYSFLNICRKKDYIGSVDIDMVRISYIFLSIHLCAHHQSKFRLKRRRENEMKGYGSFPSYLTIFLWNNSQFWYSTKSIGDQRPRLKIILQYDHNICFDSWLISLFFGLGISGSKRGIMVPAQMRPKTKPSKQFIYGNARP